jgi:hypothetical protein
MPPAALGAAAKARERVRVAQRPERVESDGQPGEKKRTTVWLSHQIQQRARSALELLAAPAAAAVGALPFEGAREQAGGRRENGQGVSREHELEARVGDQVAHGEEAHVKQLVLRDGV